MNDFTKEELELILAAYELSPYYITIDKERDLFHIKIISMIANYDEKITEITKGITDDNK